MLRSCDHTACGCTGEEPDMIRVGESVFCSTTCAEADEVGPNEQCSCGHPACDSSDEGGALSIE